MSVSTINEKSRATVCNGDNSRNGRVWSPGFPLGNGTLSRYISKPTTGPSIAIAFKTAGCNSPKWARVIFGPNCIVPDLPGWYQFGAPFTVCAVAAGPPI